MVVVCYNQADTIERTLRSILGQETNFDFEVLVADDCSTDATLEIVKKIGLTDSRVKIIERTANLGLVENYFDAMGQTKGRFIADCAGDDWWPDSKRMQMQRDLLAAHPDVSIVHGPWITVDCISGEETLSFNPTTNRPFVDGSELLPPLFLHALPQTIHLSTAMWRGEPMRQLLQSDRRQLIVNPKWGCEDFALTAWLLSQGKVARIDIPMLRYTIGGKASVSNPSNPQKAYRQIARTLDMTIELAPIYGIDSVALRPYVARRLEGLFRFAVSLRDDDLLSDITQRLTQQKSAIAWPRRLAFQALLYAIRRFKHL